jgi:hypothetical protein
MELTEAVGAALAARYTLGPRSLGREPRTPITDPRGLRARMDRIMGKFGKEKNPRRAAATAAGVPYSTWNHLMKGRGASAKNLAKITAAFAKLVTPPARALVVKKRGYPDNWLIKAVVVVDPGPPPGAPKKKGGGGSRYVNGRPAGATREEVKDLTEAPAYRTFKAEGLDSKRIVDAWLTQGDEGAAGALLDEVADVYGEEFGFEGNHVEVTLS